MDTAINGKRDEEPAVSGAGDAGAATCRERAPRRDGPAGRSGARAASHNAPAAAPAFSATPTRVVPRKPSRGINQNPAASAPAAAPAVFAAYRRPASAAVRENQLAAIGKVAPMAAAGAPSRTRLRMTRMSAKRSGAPLSA